MPIIQKACETMNARERVRRTFRHESTDRVTIGYEANPAIHARLAWALGVARGDGAGHWGRTCCTASRRITTSAARKCF